MRDDRREWQRIDDYLLFECRGVGEGSGMVCEELDPVTDDAISAFLTKPTIDLMASVQATDTHTVLVPWLMKIDWVLKLMLTSLAQMSPHPIAMPRLTEVSLSGGGIGFRTSRRIQKGDTLDLRLILPPFTPIQSIVEVIRVTSMEGDTGSSIVATRFTTIRPDDHQYLIRHILHRQAERLRAHRLSGD